MRKKHDYSENHKVVDGPHNYSEAHTSAEPAGGGAKFDDGGPILGGGVAGHLADYGHAIKDTWNQMTGTKASGRDTQPLESSDQSSPGAGTGGAERTHKTLQQVDDMS